MPANPKYLTQSPWQKFAKVSAAIVGGFLVSSSFHLMLATLATDRKTVFLTYSYSLFPMWCTLMLITFLFSNGWKSWAVYLACSLLFVSIAYF